MKWAEQKVLVTGGTRGIGRELVLGLLARGARVYATGATEKSVQHAAQTLPGVQWMALDLAEPSQRASVAAWAVAAGVGVVIHNAGVQQLRDFTQLGTEEPIGLQAEADINLLAPIDLTRRLLPSMRSQPGATLVFITSGLALAPKRSSPLYCASKAGLRSFTKALRAQMADAGWPVRVVEALPPLVDTDMTTGRGSRKLSAAEAARQILVGLEKGKSEIYVGASALLKIILRISPALGEKIMINR